VKLTIRHLFNCSMDTYWAMFWDPTYAALLEQETGVHREVLWERQEGAVKVYRVRFVPQTELPRAIAKLTGSKKLIYEQENRLNIDAHRLDWQVFPTMAKDKVSATGAMLMRSTSTGVERLIDGDISVRVPLIGKRIEKVVLQSVLSSYEQAAQVTHRWLADQAS
jgi:hypothetical protein